MEHPLVDDSEPSGANSEPGATWSITPTQIRNNLQQQHQKQNLNTPNDVLAADVKSLVNVCHVCTQ
jgi:hypothetical protein